MTKGTSTGTFNLSDVFISYSRRDEEFVRKLHEEFTNRGREVWVDWEDIPKGAQWWSEIQAGIEGADIFLFVISPDSIASEVCYEEIAHAYNSHKRVVPILYRDVEDPDLKSKMHPAVSMHNWIFFRPEDGFDQSFEVLLNALETDLDYVKQHTRLLVRAREWSARGNDASFLLKGVEIREAEQWLTLSSAKQPKPTELHTEYILASRNAQSRRQRTMLIGVSIAFAIMLVLTIASFFLFQEANSNLTLAQQRATEVVNQAETSEANAEQAQLNLQTAQAAEGTAIFEAYRAATQEARAVLEADRAQNNAATAQARGTEVAVQAATSDANANLAVTNEAKALQRGTEVAFQAATSEANAIKAQNNYVTAQAAESTAVFEAYRAATQEARAVIESNRALQNAATAEARGTEVAVQVVTSDANANLAATNEAQALQRGTEVADQAATSDANAYLAATNEAQALQRGTEVADQAAISEANAIEAQNNYVTAQAAEATAVYEAYRAATQEQRAQVQAELARNNAATAEARGTEVAFQAATAVAALEVSEASERLARAQALAVSADRLLGLGDTDLALQLVLEAVNLDPNMIQAQSVLNRVANVSPVLTVPNAENVRFSPDGRYMLTVNNNENTVYLWDVTTREAVRQLRGHIDHVTAAEFSSDSRFVITGSDDTSIVVWNTETGEELYRLTAHDTPIRAIAVHPSDGTFISGEDRPILIKWNIESGEEVLRFREGVVPADRLVYSNDGSILFAWQAGIDISGVPGAADRLAQWNVASGTLRNNSNTVYLGFNRDRRLAWTGGNNETVQLWHAVDQRVQRELISGFDWTRDTLQFIDFSPDGRTLLAGLLPERIIHFDIATGSVINRFDNDDEGLLTSAVFAADNRTILSTTSDNRLVLWDVETGEELREIGVSNRPLINLGLTPDEHYAVTQSADGTVRLWDMAERDSAEVRRLSVRNGVGGFGFNEDGSIIYASSGIEIILYNAATGSEFTRMNTESGIDYAMFRPGLPQAMIDANGGIMFVWDLDRARMGPQFIGSRLRAYSDDGLYAVVDNSLWSLADVEEMRELLPGDLLQLQIEALQADGYTIVLTIESVAISPDSQHIAVDWHYAAGQLGLPTMTGGGVTVSVLETGETLVEINSTESAPVRVIFHPEGRMLLTADGPSGEFFPQSPGTDLVLWDIESGNLLRRFIGHTGQVTDIAFGPGGQTALSIAEDGTLMLWDVLTGQFIRRFTGTGGADQVAFSPDGRLAVTSNGQQLVLWRIETTQELAEWIVSNRAVAPLTCAQRDQYGISPLCGELGTLTPTPYIAPTLTATAFLRGEVIADVAVNIRAEAYAEAAIVTVVEPGTVLDILEIRPEWYQVLLPDGTAGWIRRELMSRF